MSKILTAIILELFLIKITLFRNVLFYLFI